MRLAGVSLLIIGFLLCVSIAWAAIGFFAMGFGLICLLFAEHRKKAMQLRLEPTELDPALLDPTQTEAVNRPVARKRAMQLRLEPTEPEPAMLGPRQTEAVNIPVANRDSRQKLPLRELDEWRSLVASDEDLSRAVTILTPLGQEYLDQLARAYVVFNNKAYLPTILSMIIGSAQKAAGLLPPDDLRAGNSGVSAMGMDRTFQQQHELDKRSEMNAIDEAVTEAIVPISPTTPTSSEEVSDEFETLKDLLDKLDLSSRQRR